MNRLPANAYYLSIPPANLRDGFLNASLEAWVSQHLVRRIAQRVQCVLGVSRVAVLMVVQLVEEHLVDEPLAGFVLRDGVLQFLLVPAECVTDELRVRFFEKAACIPGFVDLVKVCLRVEAQSRIISSNCRSLNAKPIGSALTSCCCLWRSSVYLFFT